MNYHLHYYRQLFCDYDADVPIWRLVLIISHYVYDYHTFQSLQIREGFKKSKWKFKMAFAMKGGGGSRGGLECHLPILKNDFFKNHLESFPDCENVFCT